ncbi:methyltransferase [Podospora australis]|uniref:Methyltransferase n=1 Tax=Podospora australis TaxID=1536484 RepID=A0AAN6WLW5_9PEZI|nr:methyltransferase [Podospora australis]
MADNTNTNTNRGSAWYTPLNLLIYDLHVLRINMTYLWGCPISSVLLPFFVDHFSEKHLDVGVASGYFPSAALSRLFSSSTSSGGTATATENSDREGETERQITLMDINPHCLTTAQSLIQRDNPLSRVKIDTILHNALNYASLLESLKRKFTSVSMFNLLHCIPVPCKEKSSAFRLAAECLEDGGVLAGCTILGEQDWDEKSKKRWLPKIGMWHLNHLVGVLSNQNDRKDILEQGLRENFGEVQTEVVGCMLLFTAKKPIRGGGLEEG